MPKDAKLEATEDAKPDAKPTRVRVKVLKPLSENGEFYAVDSEFETSPERAAALGAHVEII